jgi:hypothetical protein
MNCIWTGHAEGRQREWQRKLGVTREEIEEVVRNPEQIVPGDRGARVAQSRKGDGLIRVPFVEVGSERKILTVYWTSRAERYWQDE